MLVAQSAQLRSKLSKKSATRETSKMARRLPTGSSEVQLMPRRRAFAEGGGGDKQWSQATDAATANFGRVGRATSTSHEHDQYMWALNEYAKRQGCDSGVERVQEGEHPEATSSTGRLKPTYDESGEMHSHWQPNTRFTYPDVPTRDGSTASWTKFPQREKNSDLATMRVAPSEADEEKEDAATAKEIPGSAAVTASRACSAARACC